MGSQTRDLLCKSLRRKCVAFLLDSICGIISLNKKGYPFGYPFGQKNKRETGIEPATPSLARRCSTAEPLAHVISTKINIHDLKIFVNSIIVLLLKKFGNIYNVFNGKERIVRYFLRIANIIYIWYNTFRKKEWRVLHETDIYRCGS